jgi:hypothetical protein
MSKLFASIIVISALAIAAFDQEGQAPARKLPSFTLMPSDRFLFQSFVDCNMAEAWVGDTFRIFPGKYGEDPLWGDARDLKYADGKNADEAFLRKREAFVEPQLPPNVPVGKDGLHGAIWFETVYQDRNEKSGKTLYAVYHNENYPMTLPYDAKTGKGYVNDEKWPTGITGPKSPAAVCRIGIMKSTNGGHSWENRGIFIEDLMPRMILKPHNDALCFAGGVGDPSAVVNGDHLYLFYGEYAYPEKYDPLTWNPDKEAGGQCISIARIALSDLDHPEGKAMRWDGKSFRAPHDGAGVPVASLRIPKSDGGGPASGAKAGFHWGPSVSWNEYLQCWVMLMGRADSTSWQGSRIYISFNTNRDLGKGDNAQQWSTPKLLLDRPGRIIWYPSLQPMNTEEDVREKRTCLRLGKEARLFFKIADSGIYVSDYRIRFEK